MRFVSHETKERQKDILDVGIEVIPLKASPQFFYTIRMLQFFDDKRFIYCFFAERTVEYSKINWLTNH